MSKHAACGECCPQPSSSTDPVLKQPVAKTTHIMCHKQHTGVLNLHPVMCIGVLYCPHCVKITHEMRYKCCFNTCSSKQHMMGTLMWVISTWLFLQCSLVKSASSFRRPICLHIFGIFTITMQDQMLKIKATHI